MSNEVYHLLVTKECQHNCPKCCNRLYDLDALPSITSEMLRGAHTVCITGGEPMCLGFMLVHLCYDIRMQYPNIQKLYVYTSDIGLLDSWEDARLIMFFNNIDGVNICPKNVMEWKRLRYITDLTKFRPMYDERLSNRLYVFPEQRDLYVKHFERYADWFPKNMQVIGREWDMVFNTPENEHFVRLPILF